MEKTVIDSGKVTAYTLESQLIVNRIHDNETLEVTDVIELKKVNESLSNGKAYVVLVESGEFTSVSTEARKLLASAEFQKNTIAKALLVQSLGLKILGKFYMRINKPATPTRVFTNRIEAINWLRSFIKQHLKYVNPPSLS